MAYDLTGKIKVINDIQTFSSGFSKREFVVTVEDEKYPQDIMLEFIKEKTSLLDAFQVGQTVKVSFDIRGREYNGRYYNNLQAWRIEDATSSADSSSNAHSPFQEPAPPAPDVNDDVPF